MARAIPVLPVDNIGAAREFYIERLGFSVTFDTSDGGDTGLIGIAKDGIAITLDCPMDGHGRHACVTIEVDDVDAYFAAWNERAAAPDPPRDESWGARTFGLQDPFGNTLFVVGPIKPRGEER